MKGKKLILLPIIMLASSGLSSCSALCSVTWLNWDDTVLELDEHVFPFEFHKYDGKTPTREQDAQYIYEFDSWEPVHASKVFPNRVIKRDTIYRATYKTTLRSYTIVFKDSSGTTLDTKVLNYGEYPQFTPQNYQTPSHDYEFIGWDKPLSMVTGDATYTANFKSTLRSYDVTWLDYNGQPIRTDYVNYGVTPYYGPIDPVRPVPEEDEAEYRYDFVGWKNVTTQQDGLLPVTSSVIYQAQYEKYVYEYFDMEYYIYYFNNWYYYEEDDVELLVREHTDLELPTMISGLDVSWFLDENFQKPVSVAKDVYDYMAFFGRVDGYHEFSISYELNGGQLQPGATNPDKITFYDYPVLLVEPSKEGYDFDGWFDENGEEVTYLYNVYSDMLLTAEYTAHKWNIYFNCDDCEEEEIAPLEEVAYDSEFELPVATKTGYSFLGWKEDGAQDYFTSPMKADHDVTLFPEFEIINYPITYQLKSDETCDTTGHDTYNVENIDEQLPEAQRTGYSFEGWQLVSPSYSETIHSLGEVDGLLGPVTIKPVWKANPINVSFDFDGGTKEFTVSFMDDNKILKRESVAYEVNEVEYYVPEDKPRYQFAGWENWPQDEISADCVLQAKWNEIAQKSSGEYFISMKIGDQKELSLHNLNGEYIQFTPLTNQRVRVSSSGEIDLLMNSSSFANREEGISEDELNYWMEFDVTAGDRYLIRVFGATNTDGNTKIKLETVGDTPAIPEDTIKAAKDDSLPVIASEYDAVLPTLIAPVKAGYQFDGWFCGNKRYKAGDPIKETQDCTLVAHWSQVAE